MENRIPSFLLTRSTAGPFERGKGKVKISFLEKGIDHLAGLIKMGYAQWEWSSQHAFPQRIDARVKILFLLFFILIVSLKKDVLPEACIWIFVFVLTLFSRLSLFRVYKRVFLLGLVFGFLVALPSAFNVITRGEILLSIIRLPRSYRFWIYHIPADIGITREGIHVVSMLTVRVINSLSLSFLVLYTTPFHEIIRALKVLKVPDSFLIIITLCYKYIFIFSKTIEDMCLSKKSRVVRELSSAEAREWISGRMAFTFRKARLRCEEVYRAMLGRGFFDSIKFYGSRKMCRTDWCVAILLFSAGILFLLM
ncbi:MAG TPA: energy-coupling factor transporter transmembrane component T [Thermodesulfobacteriota bacterium]|nr:energy-coupling factor transporter transmembrane component T [Thermodesulfobacteriota bacterium]